MAGKQRESSDKPGPQADARGQFAEKRHGAKNDGVASADPKVISGKESGDATFDTDPGPRSGKHGK